MPVFLALMLLAAAPDAGTSVTLGEPSKVPALSLKDLRALGEVTVP